MQPDSLKVEYTILDGNMLDGNMLHTIDIKITNPELIQDIWEYISRKIDGSNAQE